MNAIGSTRFLAVSMVALAAALSGTAAHAQTTGEVRPKSAVVAGEAPLIIIDDVVLRGATPADQESILRLMSPAIKSVEVLKGPSAVQRFGAAASAGAILITLKDPPAPGTQRATVDTERSVFIRSQVAASSRPLTVVNGVIVSDFDMSEINRNDIESIEVVKGLAAAQLYGERASGGVVQITTRKR